MRFRNPRLVTRQTNTDVRPHERSQPQADGGSSTPQTNQLWV
jgi:hypothetical protein